MVIIILRGGLGSVILGIIVVKAAQLESASNLGRHFALFMQTASVGPRETYFAELALYLQFLFIREVIEETSLLRPGKYDQNIHSEGHFKIPRDIYCGMGLLLSDRAAEALQTVWRHTYLCTKLSCDPVYRHWYTLSPVQVTLPLSHGYLWECTWGIHNNSLYWWKMQSLQIRCKKPAFEHLSELESDSFQYW